MRRFLLTCALALPLLFVHLGCGGDSEPARDPNYTPADNPRDADHGMMPSPDGGPAAPKQ